MKTIFQDDLFSILLKFTSFDKNLGNADLGIFFVPFRFLKNRKILVLKREDLENLNISTSLPETTRTCRKTGKYLHLGLLVN